MSKKPINPNDIQRLLIRSANWLGDAVMSTPMIQAIRAEFPRARITILAKPLVAPVFQNSPRVDRVMIYDDAGRHHGPAGKWRLAGELRRENFDAAILLQNAFEAALITALARIPVRIGYNTDARTLLLTHPVRRRADFRRRHHTEYYLDLLRGLGLNAPAAGLEFFISDADRRQAEKLLEQHGLSDERLIGISPGATFGPAKQWLADRYSQLADRLAAKSGGKILLLGGPNDRRTADAIESGLTAPVVNLCGRTSVGEVAAVMERCAVFVTNDSGLMHVAAALSLPMVAIFGSTSAVSTGPLSANSRVVRVKLACGPCLKPKCPYGHLDCMKKISVDMVAEAVDQVLDP